MNYYLILTNDPSIANSNLNLKDIINQLNTMISLIDFCLVNNLEPPKSLTENLHEEYINIQGNILANCLKLIEFDTTLEHSQVIIYLSLWIEFLKFY